MARRYALAPALFSNDGKCLLIRHRRLAGIIVIAAAGLAAEMAALANEIDNANIAFLGIASGCERLAIGPDDIEAGHVLHLEDPHRQAEISESRVDLSRRCAILHQILGLLAIGGEDTVANEAVTDLGPDRDLAELAAKRETGGDGIRLSSRRHDHFEQLHDMSGREEMQANDIFWPRRHGGDGADIEIGSVGGENRIRLRDLVEFTEDRLLDGKIFESRLDHQVGEAKIGRGSGRAQAARGDCLIVGLRQLAAFDRGLEQSQSPISG